MRLLILTEWVYGFFHKFDYDVRYTSCVSVFFQQFFPLSPLPTNVFLPGVITHIYAVRLFLTDFGMHVRELGYLLLFIFSIVFLGFCVVGSLYINSIPLRKNHEHKHEGRLAFGLMSWCMGLFFGCVLAA